MATREQRTRTVSMPEGKSSPALSAPAPIWSVPLAVDDIPDVGRHVELSADAAVRDAVAKAAGLRALPSLTATFDLARRGRGVEVTGRIEAAVGQTCVVTLEPVESRVSEPVELLFVPPSDPALSEDVPPETIIDGTIDLGAVAVEFLMLGIDPYPRKNGSRFVNPATTDTASSPFSSLENLIKKPS